LDPDAPVFWGAAGVHFRTVMVWNVLWG
jgi:hypothetical protein